MATAVAKVMWCLADRMVSPFTSPFELSDLDGSNGFVIHGVNTLDSSGWAVSSLGDVNGDGVDDLLIGAFVANPNGDESGESYVVFGRPDGSPFTSPFELSDLDGSNGFVIHGVNFRDQSGVSVSGLGDVNGDDVDDLLIGARSADPNGSDSGESYVRVWSTGRLTVHQPVRIIRS